jgi:hypothetical protein
MTNDEIDNATMLSRKNATVDVGLMVKALTMAEWHLGDKDECGVIARALTEEVRAAHPEMHDSFLEISKMFK